jgi:hypothetical protein
MFEISFAGLLILFLIAMIVGILLGVSLSRPIIR